MLILCKISIAPRVKQQKYPEKKSYKNVNYVQKASSGERALNKKSRKKGGFRDFLEQKR